jgi:chromosome segregation ATPase
MRALGRTVTSGLALAVVALAIAGGATVVLGQSRGEPADGSMAALTAEVRELRVAVQQFAQTQSQTQALGVYLSVQQSRILQLSSQLETARRELDGVSRESSDVTSRLANLEEELPRLSDPVKRSAVQDAIREVRRQQALATAQEQQLRNRELELSQTMQAEESRWSSLLTRLEALTQR